MVRLMNKKTGEIKVVELYSLLDTGYPKNYISVDRMTTEEWINLYRDLINSKES